VLAVTYCSYQSRQLILNTDATLLGSMLIEKLVTKMLAKIMSFRGQAGQKMMAPSGGVG
jgi:hypothetical protein